MYKLLRKLINRQWLIVCTTFSSFKIFCLLLSVSFRSIPHIGATIFCLHHIQVPACKYSTNWFIPNFQEKRLKRRVIIFMIFFSCLLVYHFKQGNKDCNVCICLLWFVYDTKSHIHVRNTNCYLRFNKLHIFQSDVFPGQRLDSISLWPTPKRAWSIISSWCIHKCNLRCLRFPMMYMLPIWFFV